MPCHPTTYAKPSSADRTDSSAQEGEGDGDGEAEGDEEEAGEARRASGGFDDHYDMDDDFIDDTEIHEYYGGDRRKTKYSGFFMNKARAACAPLDVHRACSPTRPPHMKHAGPGAACMQALLWQDSPR